MCVGGRLYFKTVGCQIGTAEVWSVYNSDRDIETEVDEVGLVGRKALGQLHCTMGSRWSAGEGSNPESDRSRIETINTLCVVQN